MTWKKWRVGLVVAFIIGFFTACAAAAILDVKIDLKFFLFFLGLVGKDVVLYLKEHPVEQVEETGFVARPSSDDPARLPVWILVAFLALLVSGCQVSLGGKYGLVSKPMRVPSQLIVNVSQTTVGINVGMNQATQTPEFQIGYKRFSAQVIPTSTNQINTVPFRVQMGVNKDGFDAGIAETVASGTAAGGAE